MHKQTLEREVDALRAEITRDGQLAEVQVSRTLSAHVGDFGERRRSETQGHVRFVAFPEGYRLAVSGEPCARAGDVVQIDGRAFRVDRIGSSPLPADDRPCAFLTLTTAPIGRLPTARELDKRRHPPKV